MSRIRSSAPRGSIFESVENIKVPQSRHDLSYGNKVSMRMGELIPFYIEETSPGQIMDIRAGVFGRIMPLVTPIMQDINVELRWFYCPYRILWENFKDFATGVGEHDWPSIALPTESKGDDRMKPGSLYDYFGVDVDNIQESQDYVPLIDAMPFRAYYYIYNEYFRDENLQSELDFDVDKDGISGMEWDEVNKVYVDWKKDYFTSALPWTQRGAMAQFVGDVFLKSEANRGHQRLVQYSDPDGYVGLNGESDLERRTNGESGWDEIFLRPSAPDPNLDGVFGASYIEFDADNQQATVSQFIKSFLDPNGTLAVAFDIQQLRMANAVQAFFERSARVGNRYSEYILGMYGVRVADYTLQRPEYLGGGVMPFSVSEVLQYEQAQLDSNGDPYDASTPQGNLAGIGKVSGAFMINKPHYCSEDGLIIGLMYVRPVASYVNGTRKMMLTGVGVKGQNGIDDIVVRDRFERLYNPFFEHLGEEGVFGYELATTSTAIERFGDHMTGRDPQNKAIFGYQSRYAYRKYRNNEIHGLMRGDLLYWHLGRSFDVTPSLNSSFLMCQPSDRIFAVQDGSEQFMFDIYNKVDAVLPMSAYSIPRL